MSFPLSNPTTQNFSEVHVRLDRVHCTCKVSGVYPFSQGYSYNIMCEIDRTHEDQSND